MQNLRFKKYIERYIMHINEISFDFRQGNAVSDIYDKDNLKLSFKPQNIIKLYDDLLEYYNQLSDLEKDNPDNSYSLSLEFAQMVYLNSKLFYVGLFYALNKKYEDAYTIMNYLLEKIRDAEDFYNRKNLSNVSSLQIIYKELLDIEHLGKIAITKNFCKLNKEDLDLKSGKELNKIEIDESKKNKIKLTGSVYDDMKSKKDNILKEHSAIFKENLKISLEEYYEAHDKKNYNNYSNLIQLPPSTLSLNPKPIIYDLTFPRFEYPNLQERIKQNEKGLLSGVLGYFFKK